jgi:hypothetical protein
MRLSHSAHGTVCARENNQDRFVHKFLVEHFETAGYAITKIRRDMNTLRTLRIEADLGTL